MIVPATWEFTRRMHKFDAFVQSMLIVVYRCFIIQPWSVNPTRRNNSATS